MAEYFEILKKYNFWTKTEMQAGFKRDFYLAKIIKYLNNKLIKVITGQRRVGKSYILKQLILHLIDKGTNPKNILYINKEYIEFDWIDTYKALIKCIELYKKKLKPTGKIYIFIDEIQNITGWEKVVNSMAQNHKENYEIFITGSNSKMLSGELSTYLSGRYIMFEIYPFGYSEFVNYKRLEKNKKTFLEFLESGGLPELFHLPDEETKRHYLYSLKDTILLKDIVQRHHIKDVMLLENIFKFMMSNIGNLFSVNNIVNYFKSQKINTNHETVSNYINYLLHTFLIHEAERYDIKGKEILTGSKKYYLNDLSFKNYLTSSFTYGLGYHLENAIYIYFKSMGYKVFTGNLRNKEIDFVIENEKEKKYIQICYLLTDKKVIDREFGNLQSINDNYEKIVISLDDTSFGNKDGIQHVCAWEL